MLKCEIIGNLGANAVLNTSNTGQYVTFNVAHTSRRTNRDTGEVIDTTTWVSCKVNWDIKGLFPYLVKGVKVFVRGNLTPKLYTGHDGQLHAGMDCNVFEIELCGGRMEIQQEDKK